MADFSTIAYNTILTAGDEIAHYANLDQLEDNANFASWRVDLVHAPGLLDIGEVAYPSILTLTKDIIDASTGNYRFYFEGFTVPTIQNGCYRFLITDTVDDLVIYVSNIIEARSDTTDTFVMRYRNAKNILNFNYEVLTAFFNIVRVDLIKRKPRHVEASEGFDLVDGSFKRVRTSRGKTFEFVTGYFDEDAHDAAEAATIHSLFQIRHDNKWNTYKRGEDSDYDVDFQESYPVIEAVIRLEEDGSASSNKAV